MVSKFEYEVSKDQADAFRKHVELFAGAKLVSDTSSYRDRMGNLTANIDASLAKLSYPVDPNLLIPVARGYRKLMGETIEQDIRLQFVLATLNLETLDEVDHTREILAKLFKGEGRLNRHGMAFLTERLGLADGVVKTKIGTAKLLGYVGPSSSMHAEYQTLGVIRAAIATTDEFSDIVTYAPRVK